MTAAGRVSFEVGDDLITLEDVLQRFEYLKTKPYF